jgi:hypothetical protein
MENHANGAEQIGIRRRGERRGWRELEFSISPSPPSPEVHAHTQADQTGQETLQRAEAAVEEIRREFAETVEGARSRGWIAAGVRA